VRRLEPPAVGVLPPPVAAVGASGAEVPPDPVAAEAGRATAALKASTATRVAVAVRIMGFDSAYGVS
jgi:hypothetical protein